VSRVPAAKLQSFRPEAVSRLPAVFLRPSARLSVPLSPRRELVPRPRSGAAADDRSLGMHLFISSFRRCDDVLGLFLRFNLLIQHTEFLAESIREAVFNCVRMRGDRHTHVLQLANDLGVSRFSSRASW